MKKDLRKRLVRVARVLEKLGADDASTTDKAQLRVRFDKVENIGKFKSLVRKIFPEADVKIIHSMLLIKNIPMWGVSRLQDLSQNLGGKPEAGQPYTASVKKLGADSHPIVYTYEQYEELTDEQKESWKGYHYKMTYGVVTEESAQEGDYEDQGWVEEGSDAYESLEDILSDREIQYKNWIGWSSSQPGPSDWLTSDDEQDAASGDYYSYDLWIYRGDGQPLSKEEMAYISKALGVRM